MRKVFSEEAAQASVELAIVAPILIVLALIVYNLMVFSSAVARFDRVAPDIVIAHGVSPAGNGGDGVCETIAEQLEGAMEGYDVKIEVTCDEEGGIGPATLLTLVASPKTYRCTMRLAPWPSGLEIAGVKMGAPEFLSHERAVTVDPWKPGVVV